MKSFLSNKIFQMCIILCLIVVSCSQPNTADTGENNKTENQASQVQGPVLSIDPGTYKSNQIVTISPSEAGSTIFFTDDGQDPRTSGTPYTTSIPITRGETKTIKACARKNGKVSPVVQGKYTVTGQVIMRFDPDTDIFVDENEQKRLLIHLDPANAKVRYTTDGSEPKEKHGYLYYYRPELNRDQFAIKTENPAGLKLFAYCEGWDSQLITNISVPKAKVKDPVFTPNDGGNNIYDYETEITIGYPGAEADRPEIRYKTISNPGPTKPTPKTIVNNGDGNGYTYGHRFILTEPVIYYARAFKEGLDPAAKEVEQIYEVRLPGPVFTSEDLSGEKKEIRLTCLVSDTKIYYTYTNDSYPTVNWTEYDDRNRIEITETETIRAIAVPDPDKLGSRWHKSEITDETFKFKIIDPEITDTARDCYEPKEIEINCSDNPKITTYYIINGSEDELSNAKNSYDFTGWKPYKDSDGTHPFTLNGFKTGDPQASDKPGEKGKAVVSVISYFNDGTNEEVTDIVSNEYIFKLHTPTGAPSTGEKTRALNFTLLANESVSGTIIYFKKYTESETANYTSGGSSVDIVINENKMLSAYASRANWQDSGKIERTYTLITAMPRVVLSYEDLITKEVKNMTITEDTTVVCNSVPNLIFKAGTNGAVIRYEFSDKPGEVEEVSNEFQLNTIQKSCTLIIDSKNDKWTKSESFELAIKLTLPEPIIEFIDNAAEGDPNVRLICPGNPTGVSIKYTTNGDEPDKIPRPESIGSGGTITITGETTVKAYSFIPNWIPSAVVKKTFELKAKSPVFEISEQSGPVKEVTEVYDEDTLTTTYTCTLADTPSASAAKTDLKLDMKHIYGTDNNIDIYFTDNGDVPDTTKNMFRESKAITLPDTTIKAFTKDWSTPKRYHDSEVATAIFKFKVMTPELEALHDEVNKKLKVKIKSSADTDIYYALKEDDYATEYGPVTTDASGEVLIDAPGEGDFTIKAYGKREKWLQSEDSAETLVERVIKPDFIEFSADGKMTIQTSPGADIHYSTNTGESGTEKADGDGKAIIEGLPTDKAFTIEVYGEKALLSRSVYVSKEIKYIAGPELKSFDNESNTLRVEAVPEVDFYYSINGFEQTKVSIPETGTYDLDLSAHTGGDIKIIGWVAKDGSISPKPEKIIEKVKTPEIKGFNGDTRSLQIETSPHATVYYLLNDAVGFLEYETSKADGDGKVTITGVLPDETFTIQLKAKKAECITSETSAEMTYAKLNPPTIGIFNNSTEEIAISGSAYETVYYQINSGTIMSFSLDMNGIGKIDLSSFVGGNITIKAWRKAADSISSIVADKDIIKLTMPSIKNYNFAAKTLTVESNENIAYKVFQTGTSNFYEGTCSVDGGECVIPNLPSYPFKIEVWKIKADHINSAVADRIYGQVAKPVISISPATNNNGDGGDDPSLKIQITSTTPGARIYFTINNSEPGLNANGTPKSGTLLLPPGSTHTISEETPIKAIAVFDNMVSSEIATKTFFQCNAPLLEVKEIGVGQYYLYITNKESGARVFNGISYNNEDTEIYLGTTIPSYTIYIKVAKKGYVPFLISVNPQLL